MALRKENEQLKEVLSAVQIDLETKTEVCVGGTSGWEVYNLPLCRRYKNSHTEQKVQRKNLLN